MIWGLSATDSVRIPIRAAGMRRKCEVLKRGRDEAPSGGLDSTAVSGRGALSIAEGQSQRRDTVAAALTALKHRRERGESKESNSAGIAERPRSCAETSGGRAMRKMTQSGFSRKSLRSVA
jgi:hypothetical protein